MHQAGVENVVASSGTSLTDGQIRLIKRLTQNITVLYDGDTPGIKASFRGIDMLLAADMNVRVLTFPDNDDPDSFARKHTAEQLKEYLEKNRTDFIDFKARMLLEEASGDPILKSRLVRDIVVSISKISDYIKREVYLREASRIMDVSESSLFRELAQIDEHNRQEYRAAADRAAQTARMRERLEVDREPRPSADPFSALERDIVATMLRYGDMEIEVEEPVLDDNPDGTTTEHLETERTTVAREIVDSLSAEGISLRDATLNAIYQAIRVQVGADCAIDVSALLRSEDQAVVEAVSSLLAEEYHLDGWERMGVPVRDFSDVASAYTRDLVLRYQDAYLRTRMAELQGEFSQENPLSDSQREALMEEWKTLLEIRSRLSKELGNRVV